MSKTAPGIPSKPTNTDVPTLSPIWKLNALPTKFIIKISSPPKNEFNINLKIALKGMENTFPIIASAIIQPKITKTLEKSKYYHPTLQINCKYMILYTYKLYSLHIF